MMYIWAWQASALQPEALISSRITAAARSGSPAPPYSSGISAPRKPASVSSLTNSSDRPARPSELAPIGAGIFLADRAHAFADFGIILAERHHRRHVADTASCSSSLEARLALLVEGAHALVAILGRDLALIGLDLEQQPARMSICRPKWIEFLAWRTAIGALPQMVRGPGERRASACPARHVVDYAPVERFLGAKRLAGEDELLGAALADRARQELRAAGAGHDAERHLGEREARRRRRIDEVAGERDLEPAPMACR